jgi:hypothetical protein
MEIDHLRIGHVSPDHDKRAVVPLHSAFGALTFDKAGKRLLITNIQQLLCSR